MAKTLIRVARTILLPLLDSLVMLFCRAPAANPRKVLLLRFDFIGDFVLWLDAARGFRELYPSGSHELVLWGNQSWISLAEKHANFDRVYGLDRRKFLNNPFYRFRILARIRREGFGLVINPTYSREMLVGDAIVRVSGALRRVGFSGDFSNIAPWQKKISDRWYSELVPNAHTGGSASELARNASLVRFMGNGGFKAKVPAMAVAANGGREPYYILFPGASWQGRMWPLAAFAEIADRLHLETGWRGLICGGPGEEPLGAEIMRLTRAPLENIAGKTSITALVDLIGNAEFLLGNETSAVHIAAATGTPAVCILGGGHYGRFLPYAPEEEGKLPFASAVFPMPCFNCNWNCIFPVKVGEPVPCVGSISVEAVWRNCRDVLGRSS